MALTDAAANPLSRTDVQATLPRLLLARAAADGARTAMREKQRGIWQAWSWETVSTRARELAIGLQARGFARGDRLLVIGDNQPRLYIAMAAAQMIGGVILPVAAETPEHALIELVRVQAVAFAVCGGVVQCTRLMRVRARGGAPANLFLDRAADHSGGDDVIALDHLLAQARQSGQQEQDRLDRAMDEAHGSDTAAILTFPHASLGSPPEVWAEPQAVVQTHDQAIALARSQILQHALSPQDEILAYLPLGSRADHHFSCVLATTAGFSLNFPETSATVPNDLCEIGPSLHVLPDWALKQLMAGILHRAKDANIVSRLLFDRYVHRAPNGGAAGSALGRLLFHRPLCDALGFGRTRLLFVDGRHVDPRAAAFFTSLGMELTYLDDWAVVNHA